MKYTTQTRARRWPHRLTIVIVVGVVLIAAATVLVRHIYDGQLEAVSNNQNTQQFTVEDGATVDQIANSLQKHKLIRSSWAFKLYVGSKNVRSSLQAGTYAISPSESVEQIVAQLTHGKVAVDTVTILPGQRLDQIRTALINDGFSKTDVATALNPATYTDNPTLVDKPAGASLEGYLYPDTFQKTDKTSAQTIISESLTEMGTKLTPELRAAFAKQGLSTYQGIVLASIVEQEVSSQSDRTQVAQVFLARLAQGMTLGSDVTAYYGDILAGHTKVTTYDTPYNTLIHKGLPPTPISNVSSSSLNAVAHPASTDWLYFVTGDDGVTHFSKTLEEHEALTTQYCHKLCAQ